MSRFRILFALVLIVSALVAGFLPAPAAATSAPRTALDALAVDHGSDVLMSADTSGPRVVPAPRSLLPGHTATQANPLPAVRVAPPSPVRTAHRVDGLSLPLLR